MNSAETGRRKFKVDLLPSRVYSTDFICESFEDPDDDDDSSTASESFSYDMSGKWMLFLDRFRRDVNGLTKQDEAWLKVLALGRSGVIRRALCSTAKSNETATDDKGVVCCFTKNYEDVDDVLRVANAIRDVIYYGRHMYYKTDDATLLGIYRAYGYTNVSIYQFSTDRVLYKRSCTSPAWERITFTNDDMDKSERTSENDQLIHNWRQ